MDSSATMAVGGLVALLVFVGLIAIVVSVAAKRKAAQWLEAARTNGLEGSGTYPLMAMSGSLDGISVGIRHVREMVHTSGRDHRVKMNSSGRPQTRSWCEAHANIPGGTGDLQVAEEGFFAVLGKLVGMQDLKTGDDRFDGRFIVKSADPSAAARLVPAARTSMLALEDKLRGEITIEGGAVRWKGGSTSAARALEILRALTETARTFQR